MNLFKRIRHSGLIHRLRKKVRFELWFLVLLVLVAVMAFLFIELILSMVFSSIVKDRYLVTSTDEKTVYTGLFHDLKEDFSLLLEAQPSKVNGAPVTQNISRGQAIAIVVENYTPIRDNQKGLEDASLVYETLTEGGITRFLAIYDGQPVSTIGPVRSARPYLIAWASEYRAPFVHIGGSPAALNNLRGNFRVLNIDEFSDSKTIWRDSDYLAPHDAFTSVGNVVKRLNKDKYAYPLKENRFPFKEPDGIPGDIRQITIDFSIDPYKVKYVYDPATNTYERYNGGERHHDISPTNIVVQFVDTKVLDDIGRLWIQTHGAGNALVFRDGHVIEGTWEKDASINSPDQEMSQSWTKFFDKNGEEIALNRGQIWIEIVPNDRAVNYF